MVNLSSVKQASSPMLGGVQTQGLTKFFGDRCVLDSLNLDVPPGSILGLLGHNGAGKTTAIRILTTLSKPTSGSATICGFDVVKQANEVRRNIGVAAQQATVDGLMSAKLNLVTIGRLSGLSKSQAKVRGDELLERLDLTNFSGALVKTFSGGMRRRLDLAASLMSRPQVLFLDEPTTGLDPLSRNDLWDMMRDLVNDGCTVILTTQYLEEADKLADDIIVLDHGKTVAHGTPSELKSQIGNDRFDVKLSNIDQLENARCVLADLTSDELVVEGDTITLAAPGELRLVDLVRRLDEAGVEVSDVGRRSVTLDDVFLTLTSKSKAQK